MPLTIPEYIKRTDVVDSPLEYTWDDRNPLPFYESDERIALRMRAISYRGVVALAAGYAEWVAWRLSKHFSEPFLFDYIEAVWAGIIDWRYLRSLKQVPGLPHRAASQGPVRGPVRIVITKLDEVVRGVQLSGSAGSASSLSQLALNLISRPKLYKEWRRFSIHRFATLYPLKLSNRIGPLVSREALDPDLEYQPEMAEEYLKKHLESLNYNDNPFLNPPEEMLKAGFEGVPYKM